MDDEDLVPDPGVIASDGNLPQDSAPELLQTNFTPSLENLLPLSTANASVPVISMDDFSDDSQYTGLPSTLGSSSSALTPLDTNLLGYGESSLSSLLGAFVINPQNAQTAAQTAQNNAQINLATSAQLFGYLLIGLVIFLVFGALSKK